MKEVEVLFMHRGCSGGGSNTAGERRAACAVLHRAWPGLARSNSPVQSSRVQCSAASCLGTAAPHSCAHPQAPAEAPQRLTG